MSEQQPEIDLSEVAAESSDRAAVRKVGEESDTAADSADSTDDTAEDLDEAAAFHEAE